ncbi:protein STRUBBELIG-RECEPTOR FAMILY 8 isoform X2 [Zea mays]|uniref:protein STRUBBELIG-RECEPTOR FAMILY 8 isoform X2 n=1 Tax=Zea mays TaxID=4577 RepID=UPI0009A9B8D3|nr:protein STRUBBELIG-RECEPTOR FAMILY 8-like isoform X2 [Zea mays]|eukprot:XP_020397031.1 protein STRUBBELIG-RECEPTOR FAMILY 8-like isoform X2 [Zea mays]
MELNSTLGYQLSSLQALKTMDLSNNYLHDSIPYQLPSNLTYLNLAKNNFSGNRRTVWKPQFTRRTVRHTEPLFSYASST